MAKPKAKAKPKITAKEKRAREYRRAFERVCDLLADGPKNSVKEITEDKKIGLSRSGFYKMLYGGGGDLVDRYAQARAMQADRLAEEILDIADDATNDFVERNGKTEVNNEHVQRSRLRIDTRKWLAGKLKPKVYGDKQTIDLNHGVQDTDEIIARAKQAAERLGITLPLHLLGTLKDEKTK